MKNKTLFLLGIGLCGFWSAQCEVTPGVPRDSNNNNSGGYDGTRVQAQLVVPVRENVDTVHFIRDNNDPRVITKTYILKHVDAYNFRDYLRQMVQAKRIGNTSLEQQYPGNAQNTVEAGGTTVTQNVTATASQMVLAPVNAQPGYDPTPQLGSNTAVECLKYVDGTGLLIVSAEAYRFEDRPEGMGIDSLVAMLDDPALGAISYGNPMFIYMPKYVPARNLMPLVENVGMNIQDATELWQGQDVVAYDPDLNWLIFDVENYSADNIANMLKKFDVPIPQVRLKITVYEFDSENDDKIGLDFQSWKNNQGADLFSVGGRYRNNWNALYDAAGLNRNAGSERTSFYNFNPKWNTRYIDFLTATGRARVMFSGEILIRNASPATLDRTTQIFYMDDSQNVPGTESGGVGAYKLLSDIIAGANTQKTVLDPDIQVGKGHQQITTASDSYGFTLQITDASVNLKETRFQLAISNSSLIGFQSNGAPRISNGTKVLQTVSLPHGNGTFVIGGLTKEGLVKSRTGVPWLMEIPWLGWLFSSESTSTKHSELLVLGECSSAMALEKPELSGTGKRYKHGRAIPKEDL